MNTQEFWDLFSSTEADKIALTLGVQGAGGTDFFKLWKRAVDLAPGGIILGADFAAVVNVLQSNEYLDDETRYDTLMAHQPA